MGQKRHKYVFNCLVVLRHTHITDVKGAAFKPVKIRVNYRAGKLPRPVGTEVEEYDGVAVADLSTVLTAEGHNEFIRNILSIAVLNRRRGVVLKGRFAANNRIIVKLYPVPALVAVHSVITAAHGGNFADSRFVKLLLKRLYISLSACGRNIPPVHKAMNIQLFNAEAFRHVYKGKKVLYVAVYAPVGKKPHKVQGAAALLCVFHGGNKSGVFEKFAVAHRLCNARKRLINNSSRADIGVPYFGISHLAVGKTDVHSGSADYRHGAFRFNSVKVRHFRGANGVAIVAFAISEPVKYHQNKRFHKISFL